MSSVPVCTHPGFDNFYNSLGQSPCYIATALRNACNTPGDAALTLPSLNISTLPWYLGPSAADANNSCLCSTVYYSLLSACSDCQTSYFNNWINHSRNCTSAAISLSSFPQPIPSGTSVPHYAYLDVTINGTFSGAASFPISSPIVNATSTASDRAKGKAIKVGAIAEGVVGFLMLLAILGLIWLWKFRPGRTISVQRPPREHSVTSVARLTGDQRSESSVGQYSLLATPPRPQLLTMAREDVDGHNNTKR